MRCFLKYETISSLHLTFWAFLLFTLHYDWIWFLKYTDFFLFLNAINLKTSYFFYMFILSWYYSFLYWILNLFSCCLISFIIMNDLFLHWIIYQHNFYNLRNLLFFIHFQSSLTTYTFNLLKLRYVNFFDYTNYTI
jgi:hypothetical protein